MADIFVNHTVFPRGKTVKLQIIGLGLDQAESYQLLFIFENFDAPILLA